ncbi:hypothetical protein LCGC14_1020980 [marine sediment metagenome]|uniref:ATPase AAA-type core domain-containing protein n=1 Tax=marine sediment metagenome TaxID=412755 RepID=A0A0F9MXI1_9ZZZZ
MNDMEILRRAYEREHDTRDRRSPHLRSWEYYTLGASRNDIRRLLDEGLLIIALKTTALTKYQLSEKGRNLVWALSMEREFTTVPAESVVEAMALVVGFDDLKQAIAQAVETRRHINFLLEGPPACAKSIMLEGVRAAVPGAYIAFGSRTSASGLSDALFEHQPSVLLLDEADKMDNEVYSVLLGLMESGEVLETKSRKTRGIRLDTMILAACNSSAKMPREFLSRFALHVHLPTYSRQEFIDVCHGFLKRAEACPPEIAVLIGQYVYDYGIGDVRKARGVWQLMTAATEDEVLRVIHLMLKYSPNGDKRRQTSEGQPSRRLL